MKLDLGEHNIFCISLDSRWPRMNERLERLEIPCAKCTAYTPEKLEGVETLFEPRLNPGQRACSLSHWNLWRHIKEQGLPYALILEDDILFAEGWKETLQNLPEDPEWDAFFLNAAEPLYPENTWLACQDQFFTGAYIVSQKGVEWLLNTYGALPEADCMTWWLQRQGHSYSRFPWPCIQECEDSTTGTDFAENKAKLQRLLGPSLATYS